MSHIMTHVKSKYESYVQKKNMSHVPFKNKRLQKEKHIQNEKDMKKDKNRNSLSLYTKVNEAVCPKAVSNKI